MKVIYETILDQIDNIIADAKKQGKIIKKIILDKKETTELEKFIEQTWKVAARNIPVDFALISSINYSGVMIEFSKDF